MKLGEETPPPASDSATSTSSRCSLKKTAEYILVTEVYLSMVMAVVVVVVVVAIASEAQNYDDDDLYTILSRSTLRLLQL